MFAKIISVIVLSLLATMGITVIAAPYYWANLLFDEGQDTKAFVVIGAWTYILMFIAFWNIITWMKKGQEQKLAEGYDTEDRG